MILEARDGFSFKINKEIQMKKIVLCASMLSLTLANSIAYAAELEKPILTPIAITKTNKNFSTVNAQKEVALMSIKLSEHEHALLSQRLTQKTTPLVNTKLPSKLDLGMNGVPVLNQGRHGSCVTFADTGAVDAVLGKGDYISQLCSLELGKLFENNGYTYSGWNGSYGPIVLQQMMMFGVVSKDTQKTKSCAGITEYPMKNFEDEGNEMSLSDYKQLSENLNKKIHWTHLLGNDELYDTQIPDADRMEKALLEVKETLAEGNRMTVGTYLIVTPLCHAGLCASHNETHDTWALTPEIEKLPYYVSGHEMIIIGYDDNAVAYDKEGNKHQGLIKLRNSWGDDVGDNGDFYMTYDFFKKFVNEVQKISEK